ncbi:hypothetical protein HAX54_016590, partial [Datura stramonium]|nr:hypothetical protein [Datura stramonium]
TQSWKEFFTDKKAFENHVSIGSGQVTLIIEAKQMSTMQMDDLISNLQTNKLKKNEKAMKATWDETSDEESEDESLDE